MSNDIRSVVADVPTQLFIGGASRDVLTPPERAKRFFDDVQEGRGHRRRQDIPHKSLESILNDMRRGGLVLSQRGGNGGYRLARPAESISIADVIRVVDGPPRRRLPLHTRRGLRPTAAGQGTPAPARRPARSGCHPSRG